MKWYWPVPLCPPQITHDWIWPSTVTGWELRTSARAWLISHRHSQHYPMGFASYVPPPQTPISLLVLRQKDTMQCDGTIILQFLATAYLRCEPLRYNVSITILPSIRPISPLMGKTWHCCCAQHEGIWGRRGIAPVILNLSTRCKLSS